MQTFGGCNTILELSRAGKLLNKRKFLIHIHIVSFYQNLKGCGVIKKAIYFQDLLVALQLNIRRYEN